MTQSRNVTECGTNPALPITSNIIEIKKKQTTTQKKMNQENGSLWRSRREVSCECKKWPADEKSKVLNEVGIVE